MIEKVKAYFKEFDIDQRILEFSESSATVLDAANALNTEPKRIAKTLAFRSDEQALLVVCAGDARVDNGKFKTAFNMKARMLNPEEILDLVGHAIGGVCPFAVPDTCLVYLDASLQRFETVFPACGSSNSAIEMNLDELTLVSKSLGWVDVCKDWI
jgi:prolyl-tRNA editing enzyme YbaK/EbsC (Cys-tRNA(Pro) deacylase)